MAIDFFNRYPQNSGAKSPEYPFGSFRNETAPDAKDGTTLEQDWSNDWQAFFGKLLVEASMTPNGTVDTVVMSQYYDALLNLIRKERTKVSDILDGTQVDVASSENALRRAYENAVASVKKAGDTMTGNLVMQASTQYRDISIPQNNVGSQFNVKNESGQMVIRRGRADGNASGEQRIVMPNKSGQIALADTFLNSENGWAKDENTGIITQWGVVNSRGFNAFPIPFPSQCYSVNLTSNGTESVVAYVYGAVDKSGFNFQQTGGVPRAFFWAVGK